MNKDILMRRALWVSVAYNLRGALLFAFPSSPLGQLAGSLVSARLRRISMPRSSPAYGGYRGFVG